MKSVSLSCVQIIKTKRSALHSRNTCVSYLALAGACAPSLQLCLTLCYPVAYCPQCSSVPGILQARILGCVAISLSNAWKWKRKVKSLSRVRLWATPLTAAYQAPPPMGFSRQEYWSGVPLPSLVVNAPREQIMERKGGTALLCFHFHSFLCKFLFLFWFLLWFVGYSAACCSASICWNF